MPGLVDSHVHVNEPGRTDWEGFRSATAAALAGGCTTIVDMPLNSIPPTVDTASLDAKRTATASGISCDVAFWGGFIGPTEPLESLVAEGVCGFKSFMVDSGVPEFPAVTTEQFEAGMTQMARLGVPALVHAEDQGLIGSVGGDVASYASYLGSRPIESETAAIDRVRQVMARTGGSVHILHVSSGAAAEAIGAGPVALSGETCPHYLTFAAEEIPSGATEFKCAPPIREADERERLWEALNSGALAMVVSDHSPAPPGLKTTGDFSTAWGGIASLQLRLQVVWTGAVARGVGLGALVEWLAAAPARLAGLEAKGAISPGRDADLVVWDPDGVVEVDGARLHHRHPLTPYQGMTLRGRVMATILAGETVHSDEGLVEGRGRMLRR
jgi:allantoinase